MKRLLLILTLGIVVINSYSQNDCDIAQEYSKIFKIEKRKYGERELIMKSVNKLEDNNCFSVLINNNNQYVSYLLTHFSDKSNYEKLKAIDDTIKLQNEFIYLLQNDSIFNAVMNKFAEKTIKKSNFIPDTVSMDELLNIAIKYFAISKINKEGAYVGRICTGINGLKQTEKERKPQIEAFCFSAIFDNFYGEQFNMYDEFVKGIKELYKINLGIDENERLLRAQGAIFMYMRNNDKLKKLLIFEYEKKKDFLPFLLNMI